MPEFKLKNGAVYVGEVEAEYEDRILLWNVTVKHPDGTVSTTRIASIAKADLVEEAEQKQEPEPKTEISELEPEPEPEKKTRKRRS